MKITPNDLTFTVNVKFDLHDTINDLEEILFKLKEIQERQDKDDISRDLQKTYELLDMIDVKSYCDYDLDVWQVMRRIEGDYYNASQSADPKVLKYMEENVDFFQWYVFNWIDEFEFIEYCKVRYPEIKWRTEVIEKTYIYDMG